MHHALQRRISANGLLSSLTNTVHKRCLHPNPKVQQDQRFPAPPIDTSSCPPSTTGHMYSSIRSDVSGDWRGSDSFHSAAAYPDLRGIDLLQLFESQHDLPSITSHVRLLTRVSLKVDCR